MDLSSTLPSTHVQSTGHFPSLFSNWRKEICISWHLAFLMYYLKQGHCSMCMLLKYRRKVILRILIVDFCTRKYDYRSSKHWLLRSWWTRYVPREDKTIIILIMFFRSSSQYWLLRSWWTRDVPRGDNTIIILIMFFRSSSQYWLLRSWWTRDVPRGDNTIIILIMFFRSSSQLYW